MGGAHSPPRRGGVARQLNRSWRAGREARACAKRKRDSAQPQEKHEASIEARQNRENAGLTTPSAPLRWLRGILLRAQPPLLCEEGNIASRQPVGEECGPCRNGN